MAWERGAWEKTVSGERYYNPGNYPVEVALKSTKLVNDKKKNYQNKTLSKFQSRGWKISKKKHNQYLNNNYYNAPYRLENSSSILQKLTDLISNKPNSKKILVLSENELLLDELQFEFMEKDNYKVHKSSNSSFQLKKLVKNVNEFEKINKELFNKYAIKIFSDTKSINQINDLMILSQNLYYIDNHNAQLLNDFLKCYWKFYELSNFSNIDLSMAERDVLSEVNKISKELIPIKTYIKRLDKILSILDFNIDNLNEFDIEIIKSNPQLINIGEIKYFLEILDKYHKLNQSNVSASDYFNQFKSNSFILGILTNFKRYVENKNHYLELNQEISDLKKQFESYGLNVKHLKDYYSIKEKLSKYENALFVEDKNYLNLYDMLDKFLNLNFSFKEYFERCKNKVIFNLDSNDIYIKVNDFINKILSIIDELGIKINSVSEMDSHKDDFRILKEYISFNKSNTVANEQTIAEYSLSLFENLKDISKNLIDESGDVDPDLDMIMYNITTLNRIVSKIGLNINSLIELKNSFPIIANLENDVSNSIFSNQTHSYVQHETYEIHSDLDSLKNSMNYLYQKFEDNHVLLETAIENLNQSLNDQFKLRFLKTNIESYISSINTFEDLLQYFTTLIQNINFLMEFNNSFESKSNLEKIQNELDSISLMHESGNYSNNQLMINNISAHKSSVNSNFNKLISKGFISKDKLNNSDVEVNIDKLNLFLDKIRDFVIANGLYEVDFREIIERNNSVILNNEELEKKLNESDIYNFYDVCRKLDKNNYDYDLVKQILDLSLKLNIQEYNQFSDFTYEDLVKFSNNVANNIEFSENVRNGIINSDFKFSYSNLEDLDARIESLNNKFIDLKLDNNALDTFSQINLFEISEIEEKLIKIDEHLNFRSSHIDEKIKNCKIIIGLLLDLCNDYYIEFEIDNNKFNTSSFKFNLDAIRNDMENYIKLYDIEKEINQSKLIENNLFDVWRGPLTDIDIIKNKFQIDEKFTKQYRKGIYSEKTLENLSEISDSDLLFLEKLKTMDNQELKYKYVVAYKYKDVVIPVINKLNNLKNDDLYSFLDIFLNINKIFKSPDINDCIDLLEYNIKCNDSIKLLNEYENELKSYSVVYYKFFDRRKFDMTIEELISTLKSHYKFTELIDSQIIIERYITTIKSNLDDYLKQVNQLINLKTEILTDCKQFYGDKPVSFDEIKKSWHDVDNANLILIDSIALKDDFGKKYESYFDHVYLVDDNALTGENKLQLFLICKNKISTLKLIEE